MPIVRALEHRVPSRPVRYRAATPGLLALAVSGALAGCQSDAATGPQPGLKQLPRELSANEQVVRDASNRFSLALLRAENGHSAGRNVFLSPLSASYALAMAATGAAGATLDSMRATLDLTGIPVQEIGTTYRSLTRLLLGLDNAVDIRIANAMWYRQGFPVEQSFVTGIRQGFGAQVEAAPFDAGTVTAINQWASQATNGKIRQVIERLDSNEVILLANAVYFKGSWTTRFDAANTRPGQFTLSSGRTQQIPMMQRVIPGAAYYDDSTMQAVELPYGRGAFAMTILLPRQGVGVDALLARLDATAWALITAALKNDDSTEVDMTLPRFRIEWRDTLNAALQDLGMGIAFACSAGADFSGVSSQLGRDMCITRVQQSTMLDVNEEGTVAAAVTTVGMGPTSAPIVPTVRVDRPFVLAIRERLSGTILFLGKIEDPSAN